MEYNGNMIKIARESRQMTQTELAKAINVSQVAICRMESCIGTIGEDIMQGIVGVLNYPVEFFMNNASALDMGVRLHRKRASMTKKQEGYIDSLMSIYTMSITKLLEYVDIDINLPEYNISQNITVPRIAEIIRQEWNVSRGAIKNITAYLEKNGIFIFEVDYDIRNFDAVSTYNNKLGIGIIIINKNQPPDRYRFTLAHELGHIIMHRHSFSENLEDEANLFASNFLMPEKDIYDCLLDLNFWDLSSLKEIWQVSMASLIRRAYDLKCIDKKKYNSLFVRLSQLGYRKIEPSCNLLKEKPMLFKDLLTYFTTSLNFTEKDILNALTLFRKDYVKYFDLSYINNFTPKVINISDYLR